jgi:hypothetical protein
MYLPMGEFLRTAAKTYNNEERPNIRATYVNKHTTLDFNCVIKGFASETYGKYGKANKDT